jgi:23S rRNA-/tRNA-specific pseudouridylate synthase
MRSVPIALDHDTPLDVVYEDADFVAVNKAVGFHTAPVHRWQGGSIVNMLLAHFSRTAAGAAAAAGSNGSAAATAAAATAASAAAAEPSSNAASAVQQQCEQQQQQHDKQQQQQQDNQARASHVAAVKPYVVHRLDYNTSGLLLFGKRREVVPGVNKQFRCVMALCESMAGTV